MAKNCPLASNEEFSAIAATAVCHNTISDTLSTSPEDAAMKLRLLAWSKLLDPNAIDHGLLLPILFNCVDNAGRPLLYSNNNPPSPAKPGAISYWSSRPRANIGCQSDSIDRSS
jgi:hypothetical protein